MQKLVLFFLMALCMQSVVIAKGNKKQKLQNSESSHKHESFTLNKKLKGFEVDYLTNKEFKTKVEKKKFWGIIEIIVDWVASWFNSSYGKYTDDTQNEEGPYFIFDRTPGAKTLQEQLDELRTNIKEKKYNYDNIYRLILENAGLNYINYESSQQIVKKDVCIGVERAKNAAFVYIVGIKLVGNVFTDMSLAEREEYRIRVLDLQSTMKGYQLNNAFDATLDVARFIGGPGLENLTGVFWNLSDARENMQYRTKELMMIVQTLDMLEWAHKIDSVLPEPNKNSIQTFKDQLKEKYVVPMHRRCQMLFSLYDAHNNFTLMPAASIGAASIALRKEGDKFTNTHKHPNRWANSALYNIENTMWYNSLFENAMSTNSNDLSGFSEGPHYFRYGFELLLPYFKARYNLRPEIYTRSYTSSTLLPSTKDSKNQFFNVDYDKLYYWNNRITLPNGTSPIYDDSWASTYFNGVLALRESINDGFHQTWVGNINLLGLKGPTGMNLQADYLATLTFPKKYDFAPTYKMVNELVGRGDLFPYNDYKYYLHLNTKTKDAVSTWHEHGDLSSFIIGAGTDILALDPGMNRDYANLDKGYNHNVITINGEGPDKDDSQEYKNIKELMDHKEFEVIANYWNYNLGVRTSKKAIVHRKINIEEGTYPVIIEINDDVQNKNWFDDETITFNLNGNGDSSLNTHSFKQLSPNTGKWEHPCIKDNYKTDNWYMQAALTGSMNNTELSKDVTFSNGTPSMFNLNGIPFFHHSTAEVQDFTPITNNYLVGSNKNTTDANHTHIRMSKSAVVAASDHIHFKTTIYLRKCDDTSLMLYPVTKNTAKYTSHLSKLYLPDTMLNFSLSKIEDFASVDTVKNPFQIDSLHKIISNAQSLSFKYSLNNSKQFGCCNSITNFRSARINNGDMLVFKDTLFIKATKNSDAFYTLVGKYKYQGYIQCDSIDSVSFYLPDADSNYAMGAVSKNGNLDYKYNDTTHTITLIVPKGFTEFMIQLADPCLMNCYFPTALDSIKNTFDYNTGLPEALPYKLTITPPNGLLKIRNNSQMTICAYKWLHNKDSLILDGPCPQQTKEFGLSICPDVKSSLNNTNINNKTEITLSPFASLILDSGSYTRFGNNTRLVVLPNANFIIRKNAILDIGDEKGCGHAEIICHPGSYVHFEDSADIKFWKIPGDTNDIHLFYIAVNPPGLNVPAQAGIERSVLNMLANTDNIALGAPGPICGVAQIKPDWGINNRDWGFANFAYPKAWAYISKDSFCKNECPEINFDRMLNDVKRSITFCRIDTNYSVIPYQPIFDTCVVPQKPHINTNSNGDLCDTLLPLKNIAFCDLPIKTPNHWYRITLTSTNDCNQTDTKTLYYFVLPDVYTNFSLPQTACPNNIVAIDLSDSSSYKLREKTNWHVHLIDTNETEISTKKINYGGDWEYLKQSYPDTFTFPNFKWIGGYSYAVSYTVTSRNCGDTIIWDTINVYPGAQIVLEKPTVYSQQLDAATSVKLHGYTSSIDSFKWEPTTWLDSANSLTPISTPFENITYVLSAYKDGCTATDTAYIKYNTLSYIGNNDTLCTGDNMVLLGNKYNAPLFLGWLNKYNGINLKGILSNKFNDEYKVNYYDSNYLKYFNAFMFTSSFADVTQRSGCYPIYNIFTSDTIFNWEQIFRHPNFKNYYYDYVNNSNWDYNALDGFNTFIESTDFNPTFAENSIDESNTSCINQLVEDYQTYYTHVFNNDAPYTPPAIYWYKIVGNDTTEMTKWRGQFLALDSPTVTTTYIQQIFHTDNSAIDIDIKTVYIDSVITPLYYPALQFDSTVYFINNTEPMSSANTYEWNFGDGSSNSNELNPIHTFPAFDSNYVVCLTASNKCNSWQYCDTVWVDSLHLGGALKTANKPAFFEINQKHPDKINVRSALGIKPEARSQQLVALQNYPNPFNQSTIIDYQIWQSFNQAELRITNILGQVLFSQKLQKPIDKVEIDGSNLANGLYYYSIVVDNSIKLTKTMSVIH